jgi:hypothetical protein
VGERGGSARATDAYDFEEEEGDEELEQRHEERRLEVVEDLLVEEGERQRHDKVVSRGEVRRRAAVRMRSAMPTNEVGYVMQNQT